MAASSKPDPWTYDVFVSFRGEDIRKGFMDHLFKDFKQKGIHAFRDNELPKGEVISPELYKAIEQSRFLIVIFSKNYASSSWCLNELVKILECKEMKEPKYEVRIFFYDVKPHVVRKQSKSYAKAFAKHVVLNKTEVAKWKEALSKAANLSGSDLQDLTNGYEAEFVDSISREILNKLLGGPLHVGEKLVGVYARVKKLNLLRFVESNKVHMFGICGISGVGKTTLAKAIYNSMYTYFEGSCFCDDVQGVAQQDLTKVQMQLINNIMKIKDVKIHTSGEGSMIIKKRVGSKPILLVLDNVNDRELVKALAGSHDWFSPGSLIIFTSKEKQLLRSYNVQIYDMPFLPIYEAYELFCLHAFGQKHPLDDFGELAYQVAEHLQGHPLALEVIGGSLREKPVNIWKRELDRLQRYPNAEIQQKLRPSYDGLDFDQKRIFLDIAYSLIGESKDFAADVLDSPTCFAHANIEVLVDKSLIKLSPHDMSLQMHELIQSMARIIEREESGMLPRRLWGQSEEDYLVLSENKATDSVEVINLCTKISSKKYDISNKAFASMKNLRILKVPRNPNVNFFGRLGYLSNNLRYLYWHECPFKFLPSNFYPKNIVAVDLSYSQIKTLRTTPKSFTRLKILKLSHCHNLINTPDFTHMKNLKELILEGCVSLVKVHPSVGMLKSLVVLNMKDCECVRSFPSKLEMDSLEVLNLSGCLGLHNLHKVLGKIKSLLELHIDRIIIARLPSFVFLLTNRIGVSPFGQHLSAWWTTIAQPSFLPQSLVLSSFASLHSLRSLNLSKCGISQVPENIDGLSCLEKLDLSVNNFTSLPGSLSHLSRLTTLEVSICLTLGVFPELPPSIRSVNASYCNISQVPQKIGGLSCLEELWMCGNSFTSLPGSLSQLSRLHTLSISRCKKLKVSPELPPGIQRLFVRGCPKLFRNVTIEPQEPQPSDTHISSHVSRHKLPFLLQWLDIKSSIFEFLSEQVNPYLEETMHMSFHGNRIPQWFQNQSVESNVKVEISPDWCFNKLRGYAVCFVFTSQAITGIAGCVKVHMNNFDGAILHNSYMPCYSDNHYSDIILLCYVRLSNWRWKEAKDFVTFSVSDHDNTEVEVKKCGARLVYDEDMDSIMMKHYLSATTQHGLFTRYLNRKHLNRKRNYLIYW